MVGTVFTAIFAVMMLFFILVNVLKGLTKGLLPTLVRITFIFISGILAIVIAVPVAKLISGALVTRLGAVVEGMMPGYMEIVSLSPIIGELMVGIPSVIIAVLLYMVLFLLLLAIMAIPSHFIKKILSESFPEMPKLGWAGALCGIIAGLAIFVFISAPVVGTLTMAGDTASMVAGMFSDDEDRGDAYDGAEGVGTPSGPDEDLDVYDDVISPITDNFLVKFTYNIGGKVIFNSLTSFEVGGEKVSLSGEVSAIADVFSALVSVVDGGAPAEWTAEDIDSIKAATERISDSRLVSGVLADVLSNASKKWENNEAFLGMKVPTVGRPSVDNFLYELFTSFSETTVDTVGEDFGTLADILAQLHKCGLLGSVGGEDSNITDSVTADGFVAGLLETVIKNERFRGCAAAVINLGVYETLDILDIPADDSEAYDRFVEDIVSSLNNANENASSEDQLKNDIYSNFTEHGITVDKSVTDRVTQYLALEFAGRTDVSPEEIESFFSIAFNLNDKQEAEGVEPLSAEHTWAVALREVLATLKDQGNLSMSEENWNALVTLSDKENYKSSLATAQSLFVTKDKIDALSREQILDECTKIEGVIKNMAIFMDSVSGENVLENADLSSLGSALNSLSSSTILEDASKEIISSALNSDMVQENITISKETIDSMVESKDTDYENILVSVQNTANIINGMGNREEGITDEQLDEKLDYLLGDMTKESAEVIGEIFNSENVEKLGVPEEQAEKISDTVNVFFTKMAESSADTSDPEDKDAKAAKTIFELISAATNPSDNMFEQGELTIESTIHIFMDSEISRETLIAASYSESKLELDAFGVAEQLTKEDKNEALNILRSEVSENYALAEDKEEYKKAVCAVGAILGVDVSSSFNSWVK